jgi:hypothetical protein
MVLAEYYPLLIGSAHSPVCIDANGGRGGIFPEREEIISGGSGCCLSSFWLSRRHFLRALDEFISAPSEVISNRARKFVNRRF